MFSSSLWPTASVFVGLQSEKLLTPFDLWKNATFFFHFLTGGQRDKAFKGRANPSSNPHKCPAILDSATLIFASKIFWLIIKSLRFECSFTTAYFSLDGSSHSRREIRLRKLSHPCVPPCVHPSLHRRDRCTLPNISRCLVVSRCL